MTMPDPTLQTQSKISLKNLAGKSCITHHILPTFSSTNRFLSFQELTESFNGKKAYFKGRGRMKLVSFFESKMAKFYEGGMRKLMARWEDARHCFRHCWLVDEGPQCQMGYDPCAEEYMSCSGHGVCSRAGEHNISFRCTCDVSWEGERCEVRRPVCVVANETNQTICLNGGLCKDLNAERGSYICECELGWWGQYCEKKTAIIYKMVFGVIIYVAIGLITLATIISLIVFFCKRKRKLIKPSFTYMTSTQLPRLQSEVKNLSFQYMKSGEPYTIIPPATPTYSLPPELPFQGPPITPVSPINPDRCSITAFV
ncbi:hypothetical protein ACTXT7_007635 [Hymenolepis weldensis]